MCKNFPQLTQRFFVYTYRRPSLPLLAGQCACAVVCVCACRTHTGRDRPASQVGKQAVHLRVAHERNHSRPHDQRT